MENQEDLKHDIIKIEKNLEELKTGVNRSFQQGAQSVMRAETTEMIQICNQLKQKIIDELNGKYLTPNDRLKLEERIQDSTHKLISQTSNSRKSQVGEMLQMTSPIINTFGKRLSDDIEHVDTTEKQKEGEIKNNIHSFGSSIHLETDDRNKENSNKYTAELRRDLDNFLSTEIGSYINRNIIGVNDPRNSRELERQNEDTSNEIKRAINRATQSIEDKYKVNTTEISHKLQDCIFKELNGNENGIGFNKKIEEIFNIEEKSPNDKDNKDNKDVENTFNERQYTSDKAQNDAFLDSLTQATFTGEEIAENARNNEENNNKEKEKTVKENPFK